MADSLAELMYRYFGGASGVAPATATQPVTVSGTSGGVGSIVSKVNSALGVNATLVRGTIAKLHGFTFTNTSATPTYVKFYNKTTAPVVGTDVPLMNICVPPNTCVDAEYNLPVNFGVGIAYAVTNGPLDLDATAMPAANDLIGVILYI